MDKFYEHFAQQGQDGKQPDSIFFLRPDPQSLLKPRVPFIEQYPAESTSPDRIDVFLPIDGFPGYLGVRGKPYLYNSTNPYLQAAADVLQATIASETGTLNNVYQEMHPLVYKKFGNLTAYLAPEARSIVSRADAAAAIASIDHWDNGTKAPTAEQKSQWLNEIEQHLTSEQRRKGRDMVTSAPDPVIAYPLELIHQEMRDQGVRSVEDANRNIAAVRDSEVEMFQVFTDSAIKNTPIAERRIPGYLAEQEQKMQTRASQENQRTALYFDPEALQQARDYVLESFNKMLQSERGLENVAIPISHDAAFLEKHGYQPVEIGQWKEGRYAGTRPSSSEIFEGIAKHGSVLAFDLDQAATLLATLSEGSTNDPHRGTLEAMQADITLMSSMKRLDRDEMSRMLGNITQQDQERGGKIFDELQKMHQREQTSQSAGSMSL